MNVYNTDLKLSRTKIVTWYRKMGDRFSVKYIQKKRSFLMIIISFFLGIGHLFSKGICSRKEFMDDFTTTLYGRIYIDYEIGNSKQMSYRSNIPHIMHEIQHTRQFRKNPIMMPLRYLFSKSWRARYEAECWMTHLEYSYKYELNGTKDSKIVHLSRYIRDCSDKLIDYYGVDRLNALKVYDVMMNKLSYISKDPDSHKNEIVEYSYSVLKELEAIS